MDMSQMIYLYNDSIEVVTVKWDGKEYELSADPVMVRRGIAEHWIARYPELELRIEEVPQEEIEKRRPANPLEENNRGEAFAAIKKRGRKASGE